LLLSLLAIAASPASPASASVIITQQPRSQVVKAGGNATFSVTATGSGTLSYQWLKGGVPVQEGDLATLNLTGASVADAVLYSVVVRDASGPVPSASAGLAVVTSEPMDQITSPGTKVVFSVTVASPVPVSYEWTANSPDAYEATQGRLEFTSARYDAQISAKLTVAGGASLPTRTASLTVHYLSGQEFKPPQEAVVTGEPSTWPVAVPSTSVSWMPGSRRLYAASTNANDTAVQITWRTAGGAAIPSAALIQGVQAETYEAGQPLRPPATADLGRPPRTDPEGMCFWHQPTQRFYATTVPADFWAIWETEDGVEVSVPVHTEWPSDANLYQIHVAKTSPVCLSNAWPATVVSNLATEASATLTGTCFTADRPGRSLIMLSPGIPTVTNIYFQFVKTVEWTNSQYLRDGVAATNGQPVLDDFGDHSPQWGGPLVLNPLSRYCADEGYYDRETRSGPIIPVNSDDNFVVVYYQTGRRLLDPRTRGLTQSNVGWPYKPVRYNCRWPKNPPLLIIASPEGYAVTQIPNAVLTNAALYVQNDRSRPGFNPNDEHAFPEFTQGGLTFYALRDDLGTPTTSEPHLLIKYQDRRDNNAWKIQVCRVVASTNSAPTPRFYYTGTAGQEISAPRPLSLAKGLADQNWAKDSGVSGPFWQDRRRYLHVMAAGDDDKATKITVRYYYPALKSFFFPDEYLQYFPPGVPKINLPPENTLFPWMDLRAETISIPHDVVYSVSWPQGVLELEVEGCGQRVVTRSGRVAP